MSAPAAKHHQNSLTSANQWLVFKDGSDGRIWMHAVAAAALLGTVQHTLMRNAVDQSPVIRRFLSTAHHSQPSKARVHSNGAVEDTTSPVYGSISPTGAAEQLLSPQRVTAGGTVKQAPGMNNSDSVDILYAIAHQFHSCTALELAHWRSLIELSVPSSAGQPAGDSKVSASHTRSKGKMPPAPKGAPDGSTGSLAGTAGRKRQDLDQKHRGPATSGTGAAFIMAAYKVKPLAPPWWVISLWSAGKWCFDRTHGVHAVAGYRI